MAQFDILEGDVRKLLPMLPDDHFQCCVTSPPYWSLRDYKHDDQIGQEERFEDYVDSLVAIFEDVRRVMKPDGTLWLNMGDCYFGGGRAGHTIEGPNFHGHGGKNRSEGGRCRPINGIKPKDLVGQPWTLAFALRAAGWYLRQEIIWFKPACMPESVKDRPTRAHEQIFLFAKSKAYYYDHEAIKEPGEGTKYDLKRRPLNRMKNARWLLEGREKADLGPTIGNGRETRNKRSVWKVAYNGFPEAHFATFPEDLIKPCVLAGSRVGDLVLDPFSGSGTTGKVAVGLGRRYVGIELNPSYCEMSRRRVSGPLFAGVE